MITPDELLEVARAEFGLGIDELERLLGHTIGEVIREGWWASPDEAMLDLELRIAGAEMRNRAAGATPLPPRERPEPTKVNAGDVSTAQTALEAGDSAGGREERELEVMAVAMLPHAPKCRSRRPTCRCSDERRAALMPIAKPGKRLPWRRMARAKGSPLPAATVWLRSGAATRHDVWTWLSESWKSTDVVEAAVVRALRKAIYTDGELNRKLYSQLYGAIALAFVLWHLARVTLRRGSYSGAVVGVPRGELARIIPVAGWSAYAKAPGMISPDTVTRYLGQLRAVLGREGVGLLEWHQPNGEKARRRGLPHSVQQLEDGSSRAQAYNLYAFRGVEFVEKNTPTPPSPPLDQPVDRRSGYFTPKEKSEVSAHGAGKAGTSGGSRDGPAAEAGLTPASAAPSAPRSARRGEAQGG